MNLKTTLFSWSVFFVALFSFSMSNVVHAEGNPTANPTPETVLTDCNNVTITGGSGSIFVQGLSAPVVLIQVFDSQWSKVYDCTGTCTTPSQLIPNLGAGQYYVKVDLLDASWSSICSKEQFVTVQGGTSCNPLTSGGSIGNDQVICPGQDPAAITSIAAPSGGSGQIEYMWLSSTSGCPGAGTNVIPGATGETYDPGPLTQTTWFRRCARRAGCTDWSVGETNCVIITVDPNNNCGGGGTPDCNTVSISGTGGAITVSGLNAPIVMVQAFDPNWAQVFNCAGNCSTPTQVIPNLTPGQYYVKVSFLTAQWQSICDKEVFINVTNGGGGQPSLSINDVTVNENAGTAALTVSLSAPAAAPVTVSFSTANGTAFNGADYSGTTGTVTFPAGSTTQTVSIPLVDDLTNEPTETFSVNLSAPNGATIADGTGTVTINDNDAVATTPSLSINDITVDENVGTASLTVTLSAPAATPVTVNYNTVDGTATNGADYSGAAGTVTFPAGSTSQTITIPVVDNLTNEPTETFSVSLSAPNGATIADGTGTVTINDNDGTGNPDCNNVVFTPGTNGISVSGLNAPVVLLQAFDAVWNTVFNEFYTNSPGTVTIPNLSNGTYYLKVNLLDASWQEICKKEQNVTVGGAGNAPVASNDNATTPQSTPVTISPLANDNLNGGTVQALQITSNPSNGSAVVSGTNFIYTPNAGFSGTDQFTYTILGTNGQSNTATVTVTVTPQGNAPVASDDMSMTPQGTPVTISPLANDNLNGGTVQALQVVGNPTNGSVVVSGTDFVYTPNGGFAGTDQFTYRILGTNGQSNVATVTVTVNAPTADTDMDGIPDVTDLDDDNDGILDVVENSVGGGDTDGDGIPNRLDLDSDNDGINDVREANGTDTNGDGFADGTPDSQGRPVPAGLTPPDTDGDGVVDHSDLDSDNDGINDVRENNGLDADNNGIVDGTDADMDGILSTADANNGFGDVIDQMPVNTDNDAAPDYRDLDSDNDGINDVVEDGGTDANNDGIADGTDPDGDGIPSSDDGNPGFGDVNDAPPANGDNDPIPNFRDLDSDNDTVSDVVEGGNGPADTNNDGTIDANDVNGAADPDADGIPASLDDSPVYGDAGNQPLPEQGGADTDTVPDFLDVDSDQDGTPDIAGTANAPLDTNGDGVVDNPIDPDNDGIVNNGGVDTQPNSFAGLPAPQNPTDTDGDGIPDVTDLDDDNDGILDVVENSVGGGDTDGDGIPNRLDLDSDNDGINDVREANGTDTNGDGFADGTPDSQGRPVPAGLTPPDTDGDGVVDHSDLDSDNDGINDVRESNGTDANNDGLVDGSDLDMDGILSSADGSVVFGDAGDAMPVDTDGDGKMDFRDLDSDNDGINDVVENGGTDINNDGIVDGNDLDGDGILSSADGSIGFGDANDPLLANADNDPVPNFRDLDSDNDAIGDIVEGGNGAADTNNDGFISSADINGNFDSDNDGIADVVDNALNAYGDAGNPALPEQGGADTDLIPDYLDLDSNGDGVFDIAGTAFASLDVSGNGQIDNIVDTDGDGIANNGGLDFNATTFGGIAFNTCGSIAFNAGVGPAEGSNIEVTAACGATTAAASWTVPTVTITGGGAAGCSDVVVTSNFQPGDAFGLGVNTVTYTFEYNGQTLSRSFTVTVSAAQASAPKRLAAWTFDQCYAGTTYAEFAPVKYTVAGLSNVSVSGLSNNSGNQEHSCNNGLAGTLAFCTQGSTSSTANYGKAISFSITATGDGTTALSGMSFYQRSSNPNVYSSGNSTPNNILRKIAVRVRDNHNGPVLFEQTGIATTQDWTKIDVQFTTPIVVTGTKKYVFELAAYDPATFASNTPEIYDIEQWEVYARENCGSGIPANCVKKVLFICDNLNLNSSDNLLKQKLEALGYVVECVASLGSSSSLINGHGGVIVSSTATDSHLNWLKGLALPVISLKASLLTKLGIATGYGTNTYTNTSSYQGSYGLFGIFNWIFGNKTGNYSWFNWGSNSSYTLGWGLPFLNKSSFYSFIPSSTTKCRSFGYLKGKLLGSFLLPARRSAICFGNNNAQYLNSAGWDHLINTIRWTLDCSDDVDPTPVVDPCSKRILLICGTGSLTDSELAIRNKLQSLGWTVDCVDDDNSGAHLLNGHSAVLIGAGIVNSKVAWAKSLLLPVIALKASLLQEWGLISTYGNDTYWSWDSYHIKKGSSGIFGWLFGSWSGHKKLFSFPFASSHSLSYGYPNLNNCSFYNFTPYSSSKCRTFGYSKGISLLNGLVAHHNRAGILFGSNKCQYLNNDGWASFLNTINWATGCSNVSPYAAAIDQNALNFTATKNGRTAQLDWVTSMADYDDQFVVERSANATDFEAVFSVDGNAADGDVSYYREFDNKPLEGTNYYRIKFVGDDGSVHYSDVESVEFPVIDQILVYPNPAKDFVNVATDEAVGVDLRIQITNALGRVVRTLIVSGDQSQYQVDVTGLESGMYFIHVSGEGIRTLSEKVFIETNQ